jgi:tripartite-type tricarboxylate transporter receptor subunit TctC
MRNGLGIASITVGLIGVFAVSAHGQGYPAKPVRFIVPIGPGGATDILTRALGQRLAVQWGQQVLVENRPGGGSNVGFEAAAKAPADGYTLLMAQPPFAINVSLYKKLPYDPLRDFSTVILTAKSTAALVVHPSVPARSVKEMIALAKARPGQLTYASSGNGTSTHLSGELFKSMAGIKIMHIPYKGAGPAINDLLGGHVDMAFVSLTSAIAQIKANRLRAIAIANVQRTPLMPELPTFIESGLKDFEVLGWYGVLTPAGTPREVIDKLNADITTALAHPELVKTLTGFGLELIGPNTPEAFAEYLRAEIVKWAKVVKASGAKVD